MTPNPAYLIQTCVCIDGMKRSLLSIEKSTSRSLVESVGIQLNEMFSVCVRERERFGYLWLTPLMIVRAWLLS